MKLVATEEDQEHLNYPENSVSTRKLVAPGNSESEGSDRVWPHNSPYINKLRAAHGEGRFLDRETIHLGIDYIQNLRSTKNQPKKSWRQLFQVARLITDQTEITGLTTIDWQQPMWRDHSAD